SPPRITHLSEDAAREATAERMDAERLAAAIEPLHEDVVAWAAASCRWDREEAIEGVQTVYVKILEGRARFDGRSSLETRLVSVVRRTAAERRRRRTLRAILLAERDGAATASGGETPESAFAASEESRRLAVALSGLSSRQRDVLHLVFYADMTLS